ncbi:MAG TPA: hypothetical protein VLH56_01655 [Dissulfurispiraceae bacterium]|nr:hypothetical protein [Dissulfurispiraceae bacterium]
MGKKQIEAKTKPGDSSQEARAVDVRSLSLERIVEALVDTCCSKEWRSATKRLGECIEKSQRARIKQARLEQPDVPEIERSALCLLETTHECVGEVVRGKEGKILQYGCSLFVAALRALEEYVRGNDLKDAGAKERFYRCIESRMSPKHVYAFMLYLTYLRSESPKLCADIDALLKKYPLLSLLEYYHSGVSDAFITFNGEELFESAYDVPFQNRYYVYYEVSGEDTLLTVVKSRWRFWDLQWDAIASALRRANPGLEKVEAEDTLYAKGITTLFVVPPEDQDRDYQARVSALEKERNTEKEEARRKLPMWSRQRGWRRWIERHVRGKGRRRGHEADIAGPYCRGGEKSPAIDASLVRSALAAGDSLGLASPMRETLDPIERVRQFHEQLEVHLDVQRERLKRLFEELKGCVLEYAEAKELVGEINVALDRLGVGLKFDDDDSTYRLLVTRLPSGNASFQFQSRDNRLRNRSSVFPDIAKLGFGVPPRAKSQGGSSRNR